MDVPLNQLFAFSRCWKEFQSLILLELWAVKRPNQWYFLALNCPYVLLMYRCKYRWFCPFAENSSWTVFSSTFCIFPGAERNFNCWYSRNPERWKAKNRPRLWLYWGSGVVRWKSRSYSSTVWCTQTWHFRRIQTFDRGFEKSWRQN